MNLLSAKPGAEAGLASSVLFLPAVLLLEALATSSCD